MTVRQVAEELGISASLVYRLCAESRLRHARYGLGRGCIRISEEALEDYKQACVRDDVSGATALRPQPGSR
jgi:excisionase family DNA binding protein